MTFRLWSFFIMGIVFSYSINIALYLITEDSVPETGNFVLETIAFGYRISGYFFMSAKRRIGA